MKWIRRILCAIFLSLVLVPAMGITARAVDQTDTAPYIQRMISYYLHHQDAAQENIDDLLIQIEKIDPQQATVWKKIMETWSYTNTEMPVHRDVLPDGLPQDDSLCIVVLGYGLNSNGSMKPELIDRLQVALASAEKYPNAYVAVTGGETSNQPGVSEAGEMAKWLLDNGVAQNRIIVENQALSTTENALKVYDILTMSYPQVFSVAIVSSDYHIPWGYMMFSTVSEYAYNYEGKQYLEVVGNAACTTSNTSDTLHSQAWGISSIAGVSFDGTTVPALYLAEETTAPEATPAAEIPEETEEKDLSWVVFPAAMTLVVIVILFIPTNDKQRKSKKERL